MKPEYIEALLDNGFLERVETIGTVATEHYRHVKGVERQEGHG